MPPAAQALIREKIAEIRKIGRIPRLLDYALAHNAAVAEVEALTKPIAANDDFDLDAEIASWPVAFPDAAPVYPVTNLDGTPAEPGEPDPAPSLKPDLVTVPRRGRLTKSGLRDREDAAARRAYRRPRTLLGKTPTASPLAAHSTSLSSPTSTPQNTTQKHTAQSTSKTKKGGRPKTSRTRYLATWEDAGDLTRLGYVNDVLVLRGERYAFTLNLSPETIQAGNDNKRGPLDHHWRAIGRHLERALPDLDLPLWIVLETNDDGRQHVHGAIAVPDPALVPAIQEALPAAGGLWRGPGREYQLDLEPERQPDAWAAYPLKRAARTKRHIRDALCLAPDAPVRIAVWSRSLIADAKRLLSEERRAIGRR